MVRFRLGASRGYAHPKEALQFDAGFFGPNFSSLDFRWEVRGGWVTGGFVGQVLPLPLPELPW